MSKLLALTAPSPSVTALIGSIIFQEKQGVAPQSSKTMESSRLRMPPVSAAPRSRRVYPTSWRWNCCSARVAQRANGARHTRITSQRSQFAELYVHHVRGRRRHQEMVRYICLRRAVATLLPEESHENRRTLAGAPSPKLAVYVPWIASCAMQSTVRG